MPPHCPIKTQKGDKLSMVRFLIHTQTTKLVTHGFTRRSTTPVSCIVSICNWLDN